MFQNTLAAENNYVMLIILGAFFVLMIVMTIIPQKKRKKQQDQMMSSLAVGVKIMTIGRMIGTVVGIDNSNNTLVINVGSEENPTLITIDRNAVGMVMSPMTTGVSGTDSTFTSDTSEPENVEIKSDDIDISSEE